MADTRGVFIFDQVVEQKLEGEWVPVEDVWSDAPPIETSDVGYWGGGFKELFPSSGYYSSTDKCDFSTDTTTYTPSANISSSIDLLYANGNSTHGYFCGGYRTTAMSIVDKLTYTIDTTARTPSADMPVSRYALAVISNRENGYIAGGFPGPSGGSTYIFKLSYSTDTTSRINSDLPANSAKHATVGTVTKGFFCGGEYNNKSNVDRIEYTNETVSRIPGADMSTGMEYHGGSGNSDAGYLTGGYHYPNIRSSVDKLTYSTETTARIPNANLTASRYKHAASGNPTHGYIGGGDTGSDSSSMDKLSYSSETTTSVPNAHLSAPKRVLASTGPRINGYGSSPIPNPLTIRYIDATPITPVFGYFGGGTPGPGAMSTMDKVTYANDTTATVPGANLNVARSYLAATGNQTHGYFGGGTSPIKSTMERVTYASDTTAAVPGANLSLARYDLAATGNSTHGYFGGGLPGPGSISTMDKTTYSTDTTAAVPGANFNSGRGEHAATGNPEAGYFAGGGSLTSIEKTTYSTDTIATLPSSANLVSSRYKFAATGNPEAGYFGGGDANFSGFDAKTEKITYSSDTTAIVPAANLAASSYDLAATGNSTQGYFGGGQVTANTISKMDKITYASDTAAAVPGANLSVARYGLAASSARANALPITEPPVTTPSPSSSLVSFPSPNNGYLSGGGPSYKTSVIKLSFATDTDSTTPSSDMTNSRLDHAAIGNFTHGYFAGGKDAYDELSITDKITYSNDTTFRAPGADLSLARSDVAGTGNSDAGYITGGYVYPSSTYSRVDKLTYSSDTLAYVPGTNLPARRVEHTAMGNQTHGYIGAGYDPSTSYKSTIDKITYSSDTTASLPNSNLSEGRQMLSSVGNATRGYFAGGVASSSTGFRSIVDRIEFSTDTIQRIPGADLTTPYRRSSAGTGNSTHGYFSCGGSQFGDQNRSVDKLDYSTETCGPRFNISTQLTGHAATGGRKNGLTPSFSAPVSNNL